jgi:hypothetical protein
MAALLWLTLLGCLGYVKPTEPDRQLNHQNIGAGALVESSATDPVVKQAGSDIRQNSTTLEKSLDLKPEKPLAYSPKTSGEKRRESEESHETPWWKLILGGALTTLAGWLGRGGFLRLLAVVAPTAAAGPLGTVASVLIEGIARIRLKAQASPTKTISDEDVTALLGELQATAGVQGLVDKLRAKIEPKVKGLI